MLDSMGDAPRLETTSHASLSESSRIEAANQHLETATRHSLSSDLDFECARSDTLWRVRRILDPSCCSKARDSEIETDGHERLSGGRTSLSTGHASLSGGHASLSRDHARVSSDRAIEAARDSSMTAVPAPLGRNGVSFSPSGDSFAPHLHHVRSSSAPLSRNLASQ